MNVQYQNSAFSGLVSPVGDVKSRVCIMDLIAALGIPVTRGLFISSIYKKEKSPSLKLYPKNNSYYDFATGKGGDIFTFYMDYYSVSFPQAVNGIRQLFGLPNLNFSHPVAHAISKNVLSHTPPPLPSAEIFELLDSELEQFNERSAIFEYDSNLSHRQAELSAKAEIMRTRTELQKIVFQTLFLHCISYTRSCSAFWDYLKGPQRKLSDLIIQSQKLFVTPPDIYDFLVSTFTRDELFISGLFSRAGRYVFASHRLIIPYLENGKIIYLRGRVLPSDSSSPVVTSCKYISLSNFAGNLSSKRFYNIDILSIPSPDKMLIITEGEFDCMIALQNGARAIGVPGTGNFPMDQIHRLTGNQIYLCFDNDAAGKNAINKIAPLFPFPVKIIHLSDNKDLTEMF